MADDDSFDLSGDLDDLFNEDSSAQGVEADLSSDSVSGIDAFEPEELAEPNESFDDQVDQTNVVIEEDAADEAVTEEAAVVAPKRKGRLLDFSIFDAMLVFSLILVTAAAVMMAYGLNDYGSIFGLPWKLSGITVK